MADPIRKPPTRNQRKFLAPLNTFRHQGNSGNPLSICPAINHQKRTPASPAIFDTMGIPNKIVTMDSSGACEIYIFGSNAPQDPSYLGFHHWEKTLDGVLQYTETEPVGDSTWTEVAAVDPVTQPDPAYANDWSLLDRQALVFGGDERRYNLSRLAPMFAMWRWLKFDVYSGVSPEISVYSYGT